MTALDFETAGAAPGLPDGWVARSVASVELPAGYFSGAQLIAEPVQLDQAPWTPIATSVVADSITAPDGSAADRIVEDAANSAHILRYGSVQTFEDGGVYTLRAAFKDAGRRYAGFSLTTAGGDAYALFDLADDGLVTAVVVPLGGEVSKASAFATRESGTGWVRCTIVFEMGAQLVVSPDVRLSLDGTSLSYAGDGASGAAVWNVELYAGLEERAESFGRGWSNDSYLLTFGVSDLTAASYDTIYATAKLVDDFEEKWSSNQSYLFSLGAATNAVYLDSVGAPFNFESFESGWGNDPFLTSFAGTAAQYSPPVNSSAEDFAYGWKSNDSYTMTFSGTNATYDGYDAEHFETSWPTLVLTTL